MQMYSIIFTCLCKVCQFSCWRDQTTIDPPLGHVFTKIESLHSINYSCSVNPCSWRPKSVTLRWGGRWLDSSLQRVLMPNISLKYQVLQNPSNFPVNHTAKKTWNEWCVHMRLSSTVMFAIFELLEAWNTLVLWGNVYWLIKKLDPGTVCASDFGFRWSMSKSSHKKFLHMSGNEHFGDPFESFALKCLI